MGKSNKAQRTKGNTKPSSSSHSAQLLSLTGRTIDGFIGFGGLEKDKASYVPATGQQISDACDNCVDSDFRMVMRKMLKRDAVTRLKALQEFKDFCSEKDFEVVKNVMPFWPRLFNRLALDTDRRIREATHLANGELISKIRREIAPYLKSIMGVWLLSQCDLYAPAASAAQTTFSNTFPSARQSDALIHCKAEIFSYFKDNLFEQTSKSLSEPNSASPEDMESKYIMVISGTLQALKLFLNIVEKSEISKLHEDFFSIVAEKKFWKFAKCNEPQIRGSWHMFVSSLCQFSNGVFSEMENKLATTVFSSLSESDPTVAPSVWEAALSIVVSFENCWQGINIKKVVLPQLWSLLGEGGKGNAQVLFPCLLPFLSKLPSEIIENEDIMIKFFCSLKESLFLENVKKSHIECDAILAALMECLQYICCVRIENLELSSSILKKVLQFHVIDLLHRSLYEDTYLATSKLYPLTGSLICKLEYKCLKVKEVSDSFSKALDEFWEHMLPIFYKVFDSTVGNKNERVMYLSYFCNSILVSSEALVKIEKPKVRFQDEVTEPESSDNISISRTADPYSVPLSNKKTRSFAHILKLCAHLCERISEKCDICYFNLLIEILGSTANNDLLLELMLLMTEEKRPIVFYQNIIAKWLERADKDLQKLSCIAELFFVLCTNSSEEEATEVWNCICQVENPALLQCLLSKGLTKGYVDCPVFHQWTRDTVFITSVAHLLNQSLENILHKNAVDENDLNSVLNVFRICMKANLFESNDILRSTHLKHLLQSLKDFAEKLLVVSSENHNFKIGLNFLCDVGTSVVKNSMACWNFRDATELVFTLFHHNLTCKNSFENVNKFWCTAVECFIHSNPEIMHENSLILKMASDLHSNILCLTTLPESAHVLDHCFLLLSSVHESLLNQKSELKYSASFAVSKLIETILPTEEEWQLLRKDFSFGTVSLFLEKKLLYPLVIEENFFPSGDIQGGLLSTHVATKIILNEVQRKNSFADEKFLESCIVKHFPHTLWFSTFYEETSAAHLLNKELAGVKISEDIFKMLTSLKGGIKDIISKIFAETLEHGCLWAVPLYFMMKHFDQLQNENIPLMIEELLKNETSSENLNKSIVHQILIPYLTVEKQEQLCKLTLHELRQIEDEDLLREDFAGKLGEMCCYLQCEDLSFDSNLQLSMAVVVGKVVEYDFSDENKRFSYYLQIMAILSSPKYDFLNPIIMNHLTTIVKSISQETFLNKLENPVAVLKAYLTFESFGLIASVLSYHVKPCIFVNVKEIVNFDEEIYTNVVSFYLYVTNAFNEMEPLPGICCQILASVSEAMKFFPSEYLVKIIDKSTDIPRLKVNTFLESLISSLTFSNQQIQFASHSLLMKIMRSLPDLFRNIEINDEDKEEDIEKIPNSISPLIKLLVFLTEIVDSMLLDFKIGDLCSVLPGTDSYVYTMAYLLSWIEMLEFISSSPSQVRSVYAAQLEESKLLSQLFSNVFRLMPSNPVLCILRRQTASTPKKQDLKLLFTQPPVLNLGHSSPEDIQSVACYVYATVLRRVPASIRTWWNNLDRKSSDIVKEFTTKYISGLLCVEEIQAVHESEKNFENMVVQARPGSREVIATYTIDDCAIELSVQLPVNYPLGPISAERRGKIVIGQLEWRHWLMQLTTVLRYQNGSILDGLNIWKRNLDKKFEGVEECMICYYILHSSTLKLPKLSCRVCKKKFHSACLYKWFDTSYNSTCPLCRNEFFIPMQKT